jgi:hypothetical protein
MAYFGDRSSGGGGGRDTKRAVVLAWEEWIETDEERRGL